MEILKITDNVKNDLLDLLNKVTGDPNAPNHLRQEYFTRITEIIQKIVEIEECVMPQ